jgi:hypothetical protein
MTDSTADQLGEYESQLAGIEDLLAASPEDESLLGLKRDLQELVELTKTTLTAGEVALVKTTGEETSAKIGEALIPPPPPPPLPSVQSSEDVTSTAIPPPHPPPSTKDFNSDNDNQIKALDDTSALEGTVATESLDVEAAPLSSSNISAEKKKSNKKKKIKDFVVPQHLVATETDSDQEKNRKRRALKALKNKWRQQKKEVESSNRQKSWQSFQKKSSGKRSAATSDSIFSTREGDINDRVGVISKKQMTDFSARKRYKN